MPKTRRRPVANRPETRVFGRTDSNTIPFKPFERSLVFYRVAERTYNSPDVHCAHLTDYRYRSTTFTRNIFDKNVFNFTRGTTPPRPGFRCRYCHFRLRLRGSVTQRSQIRSSRTIFERRYESSTTVPRSVHDVIVGRPTPNLRFELVCEFSIVKSKTNTDGAGTN